MGNKKLSFFTAKYTEYRISSKNLFILVNLFWLIGRRYTLKNINLTLLLQEVISKQGGAKNIFLHEKWDQGGEKTSK